MPEDYTPIQYKDAKPVGSFLDRIIDKYNLGEDTLQDRIRENWTQIVGEANARHSAPTRIEKETTLVIAVSNPIIRQELQFNKAIVLKNLRAVEGAKKIRALVFKTG